jgi:hypothetical protein
MHYAFDLWMARNHRENPFERYADDTVVCLIYAEQDNVDTDIVFLIMNQLYKNAKTYNSQSQSLRQSITAVTYTALP